MKWMVAILILVLVTVFLAIRQSGQDIKKQDIKVEKEKSKIDLSKLKQGCPVKDCIPSIDNPKFISAREAESQNQIKDEDVVFTLDLNGITKAYPQKILNWHEIVNDKINDKYFMVTFCPLCGTAISFERSPDSTFGVSGKLVNSNLVMYDRKTETLWQQLGGEAIVGDLVGQKLTQISVDTLLWKAWKKLHPETLVLSQETGHSRDYDSYPYGSYESDRSVYFPAEGENDNRLHLKQVVWGIEINGKFKAYDDKKLQEIGRLNDSFSGVTLKIERTKEGQIRISKEDGDQIIPERAMWFAWVSFHPDTELFK